MNKPKIIAFYLPQYHPTPHNDEWWGKGFTEWTNVARAKSLFRGHEQPHIPGELGFYDLRLPEVREAQAELAKDYGIYGFCYYYYRFEKGKNELELPLNEVLRIGKPDFPFMICWANETWHKKFWRYDGTSENKVLVEQKYNGEQDYIDFFYEVLPFFKDSRYIKIDEKPAFMIYKPFEFQDVDAFIKVWNSLAIKEGLAGIHFIGNINVGVVPKLGDMPLSVFDVLPYKTMLINYGFNAVTFNRQNLVMKQVNFFKKGIRELGRRLFHRPYIFQYKEVVKTLVGKEDLAEDLYPIVVPNWDHTPRSQYGGQVWVNSTPELYQRYLLSVLNEVDNKQPDHQIVFLKAWNEWGEGNYLEPDLKWGRQYLEATKNALRG